MSANTPSAYKDEYCELVVELMRDGASFAAFKAHVGIGHSTFYLWRKNHPEFEEACQVAKVVSGLWWEEQMQTGVKSGIHKGTATLILSGLYNRAKDEWSNKQEIEQKVTTTDDKLDLSQLTDEELEALNVLAAARERIAAGTEQA